MSRDVLRQVSILVTFGMALTFNVLANVLPLGGYTTGELSDIYQNLITPAGYVFSIWSVIYTGLIAFVIYQALPAQRANPTLRRIGWLFALSNLLNGGWIVAWHYRQVALSWIIMLGLLGTLLTIYLRLDVRGQRYSKLATWIVNVPFSIYVAWITVATIVNTTVLLQEIGFTGGPLSATGWSVILLVVGAAIGAFVAYQRRDPFYGAVIVWAYAGIAAKYASTEAVAYSAISLAVLVGAVALFALVRRQPPSQSLRGSAA